MPHYYDRVTGHLLPDVEIKSRPGYYREPHLGDARKVLALPSVTTILNIISKPGLTSWQMDQVAKAAWERAGQAETLILEDFTKLTVSVSKEWVDWTAGFGTAVHWHVNRLLRKRQELETYGIWPIYPNAEELAEATISFLDNNGFEITETEKHMVNPSLGFGGTADLLGTHYGEPCLVDLKTQSAPLTTYDPEHALQLVAYDELLDLACKCGHLNTEHGPTVYGPAGEVKQRPFHPCRNCTCLDINPANRKLISLIADRDDIGQFKLHQWGEVDRYLTMWRHLCEYWFLANRYDPRKETNGHAS